MTSPDHLRDLKRQLENLRNEATMIRNTKLIVKRAVNSVSKDFHRVSQRHSKLDSAYERTKKEMWCSIVSGNTALATMAEAKLKRIIDEQAKLQKDLPDKYKRWAAVIKAHNDYKKRLADYEAKITMKEEEIHRFEPCGSLTCKHCKRDILAIKKAKVALKEIVAKVLKK
ncbi:hypothetical protein VPNG_02734 [Cytospora leucostoma]|uniref:Uncharacterized protein n=1 Tax=Cytospora leucostoma TaxID=1230097 RepID=A0A423XJQ6_9PEZI|nr:hypothetical protein VPNG_02734 [Cytospora leucostoma]